MWMYGGGGMEDGTWLHLGVCRMPKMLSSSRAAGVLIQQASGSMQVPRA